MDPNPVLVSASQPPPISGGTLVISKSGLAVAADSERDTVFVVDLESKAVSSIALQAGDEPGRLAEDGAGRVHVALRGSGAIAIVDLASHAVVSRSPVCSAPRGVAYDATADVIHVACAGGELVTLPAAGGAPVRSLRFADRDLRDVIVGDGGELYVSRFRSAEVLVLDSAGTLVDRNTAPGISAASDPFNGGAGSSFTPTVAWRTVATNTGDSSSFIMVHQLAADATVVISQPGGYGNGGGDGTVACSTEIVQTGVAAFRNGVPVNSSAVSLVGASVPVDLATDGLGSVAVASAGSDALFVTSALSVTSGEGCPNTTQVALPGQPVSVAHGSSGFVVQIRELTPGSGKSGPALVVSDGTKVRSVIALPGASMANTGHYLFHHNASSTSALACASCHAEGHDDGHIWVFDTEGPRRTPTVSGNVLETAPLHWDGDMTDLSDIMTEVFERRMGGSPAQAGPLHVAAFADWISSIPPFPASPTGTTDQIANGKALFTSAGCTGCHSGAHYTNNQTMDVGTSGAFQVPPLVSLAARAPYMHDGCAATLADRFDTTKPECNGGSRHGATDNLSRSEITDLIAFLETL